MHPCCIIGLNMSLNTIKTTDVPLMKTLKATPSSIKLAFGAMCVILGIGPEKIPEAQSKKNVIIQKKKIQRNRTCNRNNYDNNFKYNLLSLYNFEEKNLQFQFYETAFKKYTSIIHYLHIYSNYDRRQFLASIKVILIGKFIYITV